MITDIPDACLSLYFHLFLISSHNNIDCIDIPHFDKGMLNLVRELVYSSETGKYLGVSLASVRAIYDPKVFKEVQE